MVFSLDQIRIVELHCPYRLLEDFRARELFSKVLLIRKQGYLSRHQQNSLPLDTCDFIGNHYIVCADQRRRLVPLGSYRTLSLSVSRHYNVTFPLLAMLQASKANEVLSAVQRKLADIAPSREPVYVSSWTVAPFVKDDAVLGPLMKDLVTTMNVFSTETSRGELRFACGIPRLKTDRYIAWLGYRTFDDQGASLPLIQQSNLAGELVQLMILENGYSEEARETAEKFKQIWNQRLVLRLDDDEADSLKRAA